jgi:hypothetical protein
MILILVSIRYLVFGSDSISGVASELQKADECDGEADDAQDFWPFRKF